MHDEAVRVLPDPSDAERIGAAYAERLMRSDFSGPVDRALEARDPGMDRLFEALVAFARAVPQATLAAAPSVARIVRAPLRRWNRMTPGARRTYFELLDALPASFVPSHAFLALPDAVRSPSIAVVSVVARVRRAAMRRLAPAR